MNGTDVNEPSAAAKYCVVSSCSQIDRRTRIGNQYALLSALADAEVQVEPCSSLVSVDAATDDPPQR